METSTLTPTPAAEPPPESGPRRRSVGLALGRNSAVYALCGVLTKATGFLLLPVYTHYLDAAEFGAIAVVTVLVSFATSLFVMALGAAVQRYYHEYRDRPEELAQFTGTVLTTVFLTSVLGSAALLLGGEAVLGGLLGGVPFWPLMAIGLGAVLFQPFLHVYLIVLQTEERPVAYGVAALGLTLAKTGLAVALVVGWGLGAEGVLAAHAVAAALVFGWAARSLRGRVRFGIRRDLAGVALRYAVPIVPHTLASLARQIVDRMFLLHLISQAAVGVYHLAFHFGTLTQILCVSCNKALNPVLMRAMHQGDRSRLANIRNLGTTMVLGYCGFSIGVSLFAPEIVVLCTGAEFHGSYHVVPFLAFAFAAHGIHSLFVSTLFFWKRTARWVGVCTLASLGVAAALNVALIPLYGMRGAALSALLTQIGFAVVVGVLAHRNTMVAWAYGRFAAIFALSFAASLWPLAPWHEVSWAHFGAKLGLSVAVGVVLCTVAYGSPWFLLRELRRLRESIG